MSASDRLDSSGTLQSLAASLKDEGAHRELDGADLRGADLTGQALTGLSLRGARLDGADLSGAKLVYVDLFGASFQDACLEKTSFRFTDGRGASFSGARCSRTYWEHVDLTRANFAQADVRQAMLRQCTLQHATLDAADLTDSVLNQCNCDDARFRGAVLDRATVVGSTFARADLGQARKFLTCREMIVEILRREIGDDVERAKLVGAVAIGRQWCYEEWAGILAFQPHYRRLALEIFRRYPDSGFSEALAGGADEPAGATLRHGD